MKSRNTIDLLFAIAGLLIYITALGAAVMIGARIFSQYVFGD